MNRLLSASSLYFVLRLVIGGVFVAAGALKLADPAAFAMAIDGYGLVSWSTAKLLSHALPVLEIVSGLGVILDVRGALALIAVQLLVFLGVVGWAVHLGLDVDCGCFGPSAQPGGGSGDLKETLVRDGALLAGCLVLYWRRWVGTGRPRSLLHPFRR
ncbi:MauE/DoxX family redox-associated membrane protein [Pseudodesulfovibrio sp.]|uniref:DoxX family protein n=1 Tax=Pseudodesulfovibrio sp. TaxID=2035812 RepID=UPI002631E5C8|nr:MauE/DoxX family redox-associated membrane protein [Pseudodesulfovibrio sp.]MDD3311645.1 DoxX family protein [Pseudodesulfovibrio sp.]